MKGRVLALVILGTTALCLSGPAWSQYAPGDNPPVFQSIGLPDTMAATMTEADCRACHFSGVPDRHHALYGLPIPAGTLVPFPDSDGDGTPDTEYDCLNCHDENFTVERDCLACHDTGSPHHTTEDAVNLHCKYCHGDVVDDFDDGHYIPTYGPSLVTPYRGLDGDGFENAPWPTPDLGSDGSGLIVAADVTQTEQGPPFFTVTNIGPVGTTHVRTEPNDLSFKPAGFNNDFVIRSTHFNGETFSVLFVAGSSLVASWNASAQSLRVTLGPAQTALDLVNEINAATGAVDVRAELGHDGEDPVADLLTPDHYESLGGAPDNNRGFGAGSCSYCHDTDGILDGHGHPDGVIWDNRKLHHEIGLPSLVNDGAGGSISKCDVCHERVTSSEQSGPSFDYAIRHCEKCHGPESLHNIQADSANSSNIGTIVVGGEDAGYGHVGRDAGAGDSDCWGCHGFGARSAGALGSLPIIPTLDASDPTVLTAGQSTTIDLRGSGFTNTSNGITYMSSVRLTAADGSSVTLTPKIVAQDLMSVTIPGDVVSGNHELRVVKEGLASNPIVISVKPEVVIADATFNRGIVTIEGGGFGGYADGSGVSVTASVVSPRGKNRVPTTVEGRIVSWSDTAIAVDFGRRPREVTVRSVYGTATSPIGGRARPPRKPRNR